jgi:hypothetical protein
MMAVEVARANGWTANTEVPGISPSGQPWKADVLARKGKRKIAIEIQWSSQTNDEILWRQERYKESGIRCLWLLRQSNFPITPELPAASIGGSLEQGFLAVIPSCSGDQTVTMRDFLNAVFNKRFRFGVQRGTDAIVSVRTGVLWCWCCGAQTRIVIGIDTAFGANELRFTVPDIGNHVDLLDGVLSRLSRDLEIGRIKRRFSKKQGRSYVSNGCFHCGALIGEFYEQDAWEDHQTVVAFSIRVSKQWRRVIESHYRYFQTWCAYSVTGGPL